MRGRETTHLGVDFLQNKTFHFDFESPFSNSEIQESKYRGEVELAQICFSKQRKNIYPGFIISHDMILTLLTGPRNFANLPQEMYNWVQLQGVSERWSKGGEVYGRNCTI